MAAKTSPPGWFAASVRWSCEPSSSAAMHASENGFDEREQRLGGDAVAFLVRVLVARRDPQRLRVAAAEGRGQGEERDAGLAREALDLALDGREGVAVELEQHREEDQLEVDSGLGAARGELAQRALLAEPRPALGLVPDVRVHDPGGVLAREARADLALGPLAVEVGEPVGPAFLVLFPQ